jgi:hypothetical protein
MKKYIGIILIVIIAILLGFRIGVYYYNNKLNIFMENILIDQSKAVLKVHIAALDRFRSNNYDNGIELLERLVDLDVGTLGVHADKIRLYSDNEAITAINMVKEYRNKFPSHIVNKNIIISYDKGMNLAK